MTRGILTSLAQNGPGSTPVDLYTCPAGKTASITIYISNQSGYSDTIFLYRLDSGQTTQDITDIFASVNVNSEQTIILDNIILSDGEKLMYGTEYTTRFISLVVVGIVGDA